MRTLLRVLGLTSVSFGILVPSGAAFAQDDPLELPLVQDAAVYAAQYGVELDEALHRLQLQSLVGRLHALLAEREGASFGGLWVQHEPDYRVIAQFTEGGGASLANLLGSRRFRELSPFVETRTAGLSASDLEALQAAAHAAARAQGVPVESMINVAENRVDVRTTDVVSLHDALRTADDLRKSAAALPMLDHVEIVGVDRLSETERYVHAGRPVTSCTSGFAVQHTNGTRGVLTAGHCPDGQAFNLRNLPFQGGQFSGAIDAQWHTSPELHVVNRIWDGIFDSSTPYYRFVTATKPRALQTVGEFVCKFGVTTNTQLCGTITSTSFLPPSALPNQWINPTATFIYVAGGSVNLSLGGDSGGPWYSGSTAYGVHSGGGFGTFGRDAIYMAIDYISTLGLSVLTTTPTLNLGRFTYRAMGDNITAYTEVNSNDYECGVAGIAAMDGDINEDDSGNIIMTYLAKANSHFNFRGEFRTHNDHESWDFDLLCLKKSAYSVSRFEFNNLGDNISHNTNLSTTTYECGVGGMAALDGDIQEDDDGDIIQAYMYRSGGKWWIRADFRTHKNSESWNVHALCVNKTHPVIRYEFKNLGDNINFNTGISTSTYECGVAGLAARDGDIEEHDDGNIIQTYLYASGGTWRIRADFRTHNDSESWDVDLLCIQR